MSLLKRLVLAGALSVTASVLAGVALAVVAMHAISKELPETLTSEQEARVHAQEVADAKDFTVKCASVLIPAVLLIVWWKSGSGSVTDRRHAPRPKVKP
jgi:hypothetical protein